MINEICSGENFEANCLSGEVIIVTKADYGRMKTGRCIAPDKGTDMGCLADATSIISKLCTEKQSCSVEYRDIIIDLFEIDQCQNYGPYLELQYECKQGK